MFTGLITTVGSIAEVTPLGSQASHGKRVRLQVDPAWLLGVDSARASPSAAPA